MKTAKSFILSVVALTLIFSVPAVPQDQGDAQAIKKAVKENPDYRSGKPAQWFKVLVIDTKTGKDKVKVTLPIALVEVMAKFADQHEGRRLGIHHEGLDIDFSELFAELKKLGPMMFIEVYEEEETVKIWLE